jgi:hypothetical protein
MFFWPPAFRRISVPAAFFPHQGGEAVAPVNLFGRMPFQRRTGARRGHRTFASPQQGRKPHETMLFGQTIVSRKRMGRGCLRIFKSRKPNLADSMDAARRSFAERGINIFQANGIP